MNRNTRRSHRRAFTIIEVMFVLIIIGLIGSIVAFNLVGIGKKARIDQTKSSMKQIMAGLKMYHGRYGTYPVGIGTDALEALIQENLLEPPIEDGWGRPFDYYSPAASGADYELISYGPDGLDQTEDDIVMEPQHQ